MSKKKKIIIISISVILVIALTVGIIFGVTSTGGDPVSVYSMEILNSNWFETDAELSGFITSDFVQEVYENASYNVKKIYVKEGDKVKVGDVLVKYDMEEQELDLQLQDLIIQSQELEIEELKKELAKLKNTRIKGQSMLDGLVFEVNAKEKAKQEQETSTDSSEATTETPEPDPEKEQLLPKLKDIDQKAVSLSGDGKSEKKQYVYLIRKSEDEDDEIIKGSVINDLMKKKLYFTIREYESQEAFEEGQDPLAEISITPDSQFSKSFDDTSYSLETILGRLIKVKSIKLKAKDRTVIQGGNTTISATLKGTNTSEAKLNWSIKGNKSAGTIIRDGILQIGAAEKASKVTVKVSCCGVTAKTTVKVKKKTDGKGHHSSDHDDYDDDDDEEYHTKEELEMAIEASEQELEQAEMDLNEAKIAYQEAKKVVDAGTVKATVAGKVTVAYTVKSLPGQGEPMVVIRGDEGIYVTSAVNELELDSVKVGGTISVSSYETGQVYEAEVKEISPYPTASDSFSSGTANPNSSNYPLTAYIAEPDGLRIGESVGIKYNAASLGADSENRIYVNKAYVRTENGKSYVYKMNKKKRIEKCFLKTGEVLYGQYVELLSGVTMNDYIAFPYGKDVKEGARAEISEKEENIIY